MFDGSGHFHICSAQYLLKPLIVVEYVVEVFVVGGKIGQVIVPGAFDGQQGGVMGGLLLQHLPLIVWNEPVFIAVYNKDRAGDLSDKLIGAYLIPQQPLQGQNKAIATNLVKKTVIGRVQDEHPGPVPTRDPGGDPAAQGAAVNNDLLFRVMFAQPLIHGLGVVIQSGLRTPAATFAKSPVIDHKKIIAFAQKVPGEFRPSLDTAGIALEIEHYALGVGHFEV